MVIWVSAFNTELIQSMWNFEFCYKFKILAFQYLKQVLKINNAHSKCTASGPANQSKG